MNIGFAAGSLHKIGSGQTMAVPLAKGLQIQGHNAYGLEVSRLRNFQTKSDSLPVFHRGLLPYLRGHPLQVAKSFLRRVRQSTTYPLVGNQLDTYDLAAGHVIKALASELRLDVVLAFHNEMVVRILPHWPQSRCILAINLVGFGIDRRRGGSIDTFPLQRLIFQRPYWDLHIAATRFEYEQYLGIYRRLGLGEERLIHLPHCYDQELFRPAQTSSSSFSAAEPATLLYPVNVYPRKNIELALETLAITTRSVSARLVVTGRIWDEPYHRRLLEQARQLGVAGQVEFLGGVPLEQLIHYYQAADITLFTSHQETFGLGLVESMACGTPVVGPAWIRPTAEILRELPGGIAVPKTAESLAEAVLQTLQAPLDPAVIARATRAQYGNAGVAKRFRAAIVAIKQAKDKRQAALRNVDWKALYCDEGDLL